MPQRFKIETQEKEKPIILITGDNPLIPLFAAALGEKFKIVLISEQAVSQGDVYKIDINSAHLIKDLAEEISYAVIFIDNASDRNYLASIFEKLAEDKTKTAVIINIREVEEFFDIALSAKTIPSFYFLLLGDVYSETGNINELSEISKLIQTAINKRSVNFGGDDLEPIFPIYYKDAISGINQVLFGLPAQEGPPKKDKFYYLFYSHPQSLISAVHIIKRVEHDLEIQYSNVEKNISKQKSQEEIERIIQSKIVTKPVFLDRYFIGFEKSLSLFLGRTERERGRPAASGARQRWEPESKIIPKKSDVKFLGKSIFISFLLFILINIILTASSIIFLKATVSSFKKNDYKTALRNINNAKLALEITDPTLQGVAAAGNLFGITKISETLEIVNSSITLASIAGENFESIQKIPKGVDRERFEKLIASGVYLYFKAQEKAFDFQNETLNILQSSDIAKIASISQVAAAILGYNSEKNYLLLFQNNGELRPTGGFIGSVGELKIKGGKIEEFKINDVYEYDGKLKAHVEPHYIIRRYLQPHLYLRDSNFDPDFQNSASTAALLFNLATEKKVDGVIAINFEAVRRIIKIVGPVKLAQYNKTLDENNTFEFLQETIDDDFFPGSTQKRDVLQALFNQLMLKFEEDQNNFIKVAGLMVQLADEKHILFAFNGKSTQAVFSSNGYGGDLPDLRSSEESVNDYLAINHANIGVNKANAYIKQETEYEVQLADSKVKSKVKQIIDNTKESAKDYMAYVRVFTPLGSRLTSIKIDGKEQKLVESITDPKVYESKSFKAPAEALETDEITLLNKQVLGFIINVPKKAKQVIEVNYDNGVTQVSSAIFKYSLLVIKQPGILTYPFTLAIVYGEKFAPRQVSNATLEENIIKIKKDILSDEILEAELIRR